MTVTTTALLTRVSRNLPALSFLSARHVVSPLRVKLKIVCANRAIFFCFVKGEFTLKHIKIREKAFDKCRRPLFWVCVYGLEKNETFTLV